MNKSMPEYEDSVLKKWVIRAIDALDSGEGVSIDELRDALISMLADDLAVLVIQNTIRILHDAQTGTLYYNPTGKKERTQDE